MAAVTRAWEPRTASERAVQLALIPASLAYGAAVAIRNRLYDAGWLEQARVDARVLSVGNLTVGGTGRRRRRSGWHRRWSIAGGALRSSPGAIASGDPVW